MICKPKILAVEDDSQVSVVIVHLLTEAGCEVLVAYDGLDAIKRAQKEEFDLIVLDIDLPGIDGFEVCAWLKQDFRFNRTPVIFISGKDDEENSQRVFALGAVDYIKKPFDGMLFVQKIWSHLPKHLQIKIST
jgi:DNA-binding response OmpR family regulator